MSRKRIILFWIVYCLTLPQMAYAGWQRFEQDIMGTLVRVEIQHEQDSRRLAASQAVFAEMHRLDAMLSPHLADSELSRLNRRAGRAPVEVSGELAALLQRALYFSRLSQGAFDITYASVGHLYDYRRGIRPSPEAVSASLPAVNYRHVVINGNRVRFDHPGVVIDLGGIAKGYAVDRAIAILRQYGIDQALVSAGGDSRIIGSRDGRPWMIGIRDPDRDGRSAVVLPLQNNAISTSGDYERYFERDGRRYHHILTPATGKSPRELRSVTIIGARGIDTDAISTTVFVLGTERGLRLVERLPGIEAVLIDSQGRIHYSRGFEPAS